MRADLIAPPTRAAARATCATARRMCCAAVAAAALLVATAPTARAQTATQEDLRALTFYLEQGDQASVQAELQRLRNTFPDWRPPANLNDLISPSGSGPTAVADVAGMWVRIERGDYSGAREMIDRARRNVPGWSPDPEMLRVLEINEAQSTFDRAVAARNAPDAIAVARRAPQLLRCDRINNAWQLADMYQLAGQTGNAVATHRNTLASCTRLRDAQPTLEKADAIASWPQMSELFDTARSANPTSRAQLDALEARLRAGRGGQTAAPAPQSAPRSAQATAPSASAPRPTQTAAAPVAAAPAPAAPGASAPPSGALPARGDGRITQVRTLKESRAWSRCLAQSANPRSLDVVYERAWCAFSHNRPAEALTGFMATIRGGAGLGGEVLRDAHFGLALSHLSLNMTEAGAEAAARANLTAQQRAEVEAIVLDQRAVRAFRLGEYRQAIAYLDTLDQLENGLRRDLALLRAYAHLNSGQRTEARAQFERLHAQLATSETRAGLEAARGPGN